MKQFKYNLDTVLDYKTQILDNLKTEHAVMLGHVHRKQEEIENLKEELEGFSDAFDQTKTTGASIENFRLFDLCIERMEEIISVEKDELSSLKKREASKKKEVITAKIDTAKYEKLKEKRFQAYHKAEMKAEEGHVEELVVREINRKRLENR